MGAYSNRVIADGASYYWRLNDTSGLTAVAAVGGANGTISGGVTLGQAGAIADGTTAMGFDATGRIVTAARTFTVPYSVEAWVKLTATGEHGYFGITGGGTLYFGCAVQPTQIQANIGFGDGTGSFPAVTGVTVNDGQWHHVVWVLGGGTTISAYVDGASRTPDSQLLKPLPAITSPVQIPEVGVIFGQGWLGALDDVAIYPRALTAAEVAAHYAIGRTTEVGAQGPYADRVISDGASNYWRLNESSGLVARDIVGAKDGTISGGVTLSQPSPLSDGTSAMLFNGTTGKIVTAANIAFTIPYTLEWWMRTTDTTQRAFVSNSPGPVNGAFNFDLYLNKLHLHYCSAAGEADILGNGPVLTDGQWHHVVVVFTGTRIDAYVDTVVLPGWGVTNGAMAGITRPLELGTSAVWAQFFQGSLDEVAIYPRALSASEVAAHYALSTVPVPRDLNTGLYTYLLGVFGVSAGTSYADRVRADGATNHWRLGETSGTTAVDAIGGANGTISGGVTLNQPSALADGDTAMTFDNTTGKIVTPPVTLPASCSVELWVRKAAEGTYRTWLSLRPDAEAQIAYDGINHVAYIYNGAVVVAGTKIIDDGGWHHLVVVWTGSTGTMYVDGVVDVSAAHVFTSRTGPVRLAHDATTTNVSLLGSLDDVSIYPRALTANEIAAHYSLGRSGLSGGNDLTTLITRYLATLTGDMTARWKQMEKNAGF